MYVIIKYPKNLRNACAYDFHIYTKQNTIKEKLLAYYEEQKNRHISCQVLIVERKTAIKMDKVWNNYFTNIGKKLTREQSIKSFYGHENVFEEEEWEEE